MSSRAMPSAWVNLPMLGELPLDGPGRVLLTLSLDAALSTVMAGRCETVVMVVGVFNRLHDPTKLLDASASADDNQARPGFHLLFGSVMHPASSLALELWWWLCRWHAACPRDAEAWRDLVLAGLPSEDARSRERALSLVVSGTAHRVPLLEPGHADTLALRERIGAAELAALDGLQAKLGSLPPALAVDIGLLLLYLLQRRAEVRHGKRRAGKQANFYPKLYVVERRLPDAALDTFVIAGSVHRTALELEPDASGHLEMATIHRVAGAAYSQTRPGQSLGADLAATARAQFAEAPMFARWLGHGASDVCPVGSLAELLEVPSHLLARMRELGDEGEGAATTTLPLSSDDQRRLAHAICRDIEIALGLDTRTLDATVHTLRGLEHAWHGKRPSTYQLDGAARLLALLQHGRGAMLTDEPGLGKTLVAQLVAAALIRERLVLRRELAHAQARAIDSLPRLRVSILAPARVLGHEARAQAATQWFRHALEIRSAVAEALGDAPELRALAERHDYLDIRLFSNQSLSRALVDEHEGKLRAVVVEGLDHLACSEIVIVDEAHNFRNGGGRATRLLRLCLSLPVWGESDWRAPQSDGALQPDLPRPDALASATGRKIVLLSATPFNNRIQDVSTQLGHFAKAQAWTNPAPDLRDALDRRVHAAPHEPRYWSGAPATPGQATARSDFERMLVAVAPKHIAGGRALDPDDIKALQRQLRDDDSHKVRDGGPTYCWAGRHAGLGRIFAAIGQQLEAEHAGQAVSRDVAGDTRARIDAMLLDHVVQRSRRQVLDFVVHNEGATACAAMFRAPQQPRAPLPIHSRTGRETDHETQEREILESLFVLLDREGHAAGEASQRLGMLAYELRYMRGFERGAGTGARSLGASNFIAFQSVNLIKRLQSSSYAFLMTLVRGLLRTNLYELALAEAIVEAMSGSRDELHGQRTLAIGEDRGVRLAAARAGCERASAAVRARLEGSTNLEQLRRLFGHRHAHAAAPSSAASGYFAGLLDIGRGGNHEEGRERLEQDLELAVNYLRLGLKERPKGRARKAPSPELPPPTHWVDRLLDDLAAARSRIADDALRCLAWMFDEREGLVRIVYGGLERRAGESMASLVRHARTSDALIGWLIARMEADRRAADLVAFLLAQTALRRASAHDPSLRDHAPGGDRALMFSEYADTLDYLRVLLSTLHRACSRLDALKVNERKRVLRMLDDLRTRAVAICESLAVATTSTLLSLRKLDASLFPPPLDPARVAELLPDAQAVAGVAIELVEHAAIVTSRIASGERLIADAAAEDSGERLSSNADAMFEADDTLDPEAGSGSSVDDAPALDAFSPWYQVDATSVGQGLSEAVARRLADAQRRPVYTLLATEVLAEGVNLQECGIAIHYDLPWNPTRLIQRNGRVDRRIDPRVEHPEQRRALVAQLVAAAGGDVEIDAERFWAPRNVYHLTVPPIEPKLDASHRTVLIQRVRKVLFEKLSGIRRLFGLSAWPVVLGIDDAAQVLDGSLAYETAAFRRREELFMHWRTLRERLPARPGERAPTHGTFTVTLAPEQLARLHAALADAGPEAQLRPDRLRSLLVSLWSSSHPRSIPLRSGVDVSPFVVSDALLDEAFAARWRAPLDHTGGVLALVQTPDDVIAWRVRSERVAATQVKRTVLGSCMVARARTTVLAHEPDVDWQNLAHAPAGSEPSGPTSPTAMVEIVLDVIASALLDGKLVAAREVQGLPADWAELAADRRLGLLLRRPSSEVANNYAPTTVETHAEGFNLVVTGTSAHQSRTSFEPG